MLLRGYAPPPPSGSTPCAGVGAVQWGGGALRRRAEGEEVALTVSLRQAVQGPKCQERGLTLPCGQVLHPCYST